MKDHTCAWDTANHSTLADVFADLVKVGDEEAETYESGGESGAV